MELKTISAVDAGRGALTGANAEIVSIRVLLLLVLTGTFAPKMTVCNLRSDRIQAPRACR